MLSFKQQQLKILNKTGGQIKMGSLSDEALAYEPPQTKNISELESVPTDCEVEEREGLNKQQKKFTYKVIIVDGEEYRVPNSVLKSLKAILEEKPDLKNIKVKKSGEGLKTEYTVVELN